LKRILIIHNILWSHYKAVVFSELYKITKNENIDMFVLQIALTEKRRRNIGDIDLSLHKYPYKLLFEKSIEETTIIERILSLLKEIFRYKPDVIVIPGWDDPAYIIIALIAKFLGIKQILQNDSTEYDKPRKLYKELIKKFIVKLADASWCYGTASRNYLVKLGMKEEKIFIRCQATINDEIEKTYLSYLELRDELKRKYNFKPKNFIYVGRLSSEKNVETLIRAFANVKNDNWGLIIVGDGPLKEKLEGLIKDLNLKEVYFVGGKSWKEVPKFYALADVFVLPSISEPWGLVVNEAMVCSLPIIISNKVGASFDLVREGENGYIFNPYNQKELEEIMLKFIEEKVDMKRMGKKSREIIMRYTPENAAKQMYEAIRFCLGTKL